MLLAGSPTCKPVQDSNIMMMLNMTEFVFFGPAFGLPGGPEWIVLLVLGLLIFGRRLPEVGRSLGRGIVEFKRGIKGIEDEIDDESNRPALPKNNVGGNDTFNVPTGAAETAAAPEGSSIGDNAPDKSS